MRIRRIPPVQQAPQSRASLLYVDRQESSGRSSRRRGVTAMEYLVMISFILLVLIVTVQKLGLVTGGMLQNSANATNLTN